MSRPMRKELGWIKDRINVKKYIITCCNVDPVMGFCICMTYFMIYNLNMLTWIK